MSRIAVTISKWINIIAHLRENFEAHRVSGIIIFQLRVAWNSLETDLHKEMLKRRKHYAWRIVRAISAGEITRGEYVTLYAHKDHLIARKITWHARPKVICPV